MRKIAFVVAAAMLVAAPVTAEEVITEPVPTAACETSEDFPTLGLDGVKEAVTPAAVPAVGTDADDAARGLGQDAPDMPYHEQSAVSYQFRLDLSGSDTVVDAQTGNVSINLMWDNDGDYDLYVYDAEGNPIGEGANGFNPLDGAGENMMLSRAAHCTDFRVDVVNYLGASPVTAMELNLNISGLRS